MMESDLYTSAFLSPDFLKHQSNIAVAVSGGPDSMALLYLLADICNTHNLATHIHALTINHNLRTDAYDEAVRVGNSVNVLSNVTHTILNWQSPNTQSRIMEAARDARYQLMAKYCETHNIVHLFIGHHMDDQAETFLFRLAKGSGLDGLSCMSETHTYNQHLTHVRPLLNVSKQSLIEYCTETNIPFNHDPSNENETYARPRLRAAKDILADEGLTSKRLATTSMRMARARTALEWLTEKAWKECVRIDTHGLSLNLSLSLTYPDEVSVRLLQKSLYELDVIHTYAPRLEKIENLLGELKKDGKNFRKQTFSHVIFEVVETNSTLTLVMTKENN